MNINDIDVGILTFLADNIHSTTTDIAKALFKPKNSKETVKIDSMIRYRLKKLVKKNIVTKSNSERSYYDINRSKVFFGYGDLKINVENAKDLTMNLGYFIAITNAGKDVIIKNLDDYEERYGIKSA